MKDSQIEISKPDTQKEIVIRSQKELDKLLDDNYNALDEVAVIDKNISLDSRRRKTYWTKGKASFKHAIKCKNIDAERLNIESSSKITAHDVEAWNIKCTNIHAHDINCQDLEAKTVWADSIRAEHIYSKNVRVRDSILMNL
jgi:hypothetical protein